MRALIATLLLVFGGVVCTVDAVGIYAHGSIPVFTAQSVDGVESIVTSVSPEAASEGLRVGDRYHLGENWPLSRATHGWSTRGAIPPDIDVPMSLYRAGQPMVIQLRSAAATPGGRLAMWLDVAFKFLGTLIGALLVVRGRDAFGLYAGIGIAGMSLTSGFISGLYLGSFTLTAIVDVAIGTIALSARYFLVEAMLAICGLRRAEAAIIRVMAIGASVFLLVMNVSITYSNITENLAIASFFASPSLDRWFYLAQLSLRVDLLGYLLAWLRPRAADREVIAWTFAATYIGLSGPTVNLILRLLGDTAPLGGALNLTLVLLAAGYAYVALRYRIVNISFVLNRAVVYAALGSLVLAVFVIVEVIVTRLAVGKTSSAVIEVLAALAIGFTIKQLEQRVDAVVERVLFAAKHRAEEALRELIRDCGHVEHLPALFARACTESRRILSADRVTIYETRDEGYAPAYSSPEGFPVPPADIDDGAFVRLRSRRESLDLHDMASAVGSEGLLFPMLVRGRLLGAIYFGPKAKRAAYDPDERKLLLDLAHEVGASSLVLSLSEATLR
jgi:hypothetical protein